jgi:hypothetical protein
MKTKGQAALEFLMTYGWAILIVIAVVAALYAMGVFQLPSGGLSKCSPCFGSGSGVAYVDHNATALIVRVGPAPISDASANGGTVAAGPFDTGDNVELAGTFSGDVDVTIAYTDDNSGLRHSSSITLHGG